MTTQCEFRIGGRPCVYAHGHGGEHFTPGDARDYSDAIRLRVVKDRVELQYKELTELRSELTECIDYLTAEREKATGREATIAAQRDCLEWIAKLVTKDSLWWSRIQKALRSDAKTEHAAQLAAYRRVLEKIKARIAHPEKTDRWHHVAYGMLEIAEAALQSPDLGKALLEEHAAELERRAEKAITDYINAHSITCDCCQHAMIDVTAEGLGGNGKTHCITGDPEGDGAACAHGMATDMKAIRQQLDHIQRAENGELKAAYAELQAHNDELFALRRRAEAAESKAGDYLKFLGQVADSLCCTMTDSQDEWMCAIEDGVADLWKQTEAAEMALVETREERRLLAHGYRVLRATQAADLTRVEERYNVRLREVEEGKRKAEAELVAALAPAHYKSTACHHGAHSDCRLACKFCGQGCICSCHAVDMATGATD